MIIYNSKKKTFTQAYIIQYACSQHRVRDHRSHQCKEKKKEKTLERYKGVSDQQPGPYNRWPLTQVHSSASLLRRCSDLSTAECQLTNVGAIGDGDGP